MKKNILITGGAGFIGSHLVKFFVSKYPDYNIFNLDNLTYAGNLDNLSSIENHSNYKFLKADICDYKLILNIFKKYNITDVIHLAAESHVDRSIQDPFSFAKTNILGTLSLINSAKIFWSKELDNHLFYHVSTDEVYGSLSDDGYFTESTPYDPHSPYSASKASSDHFVRAYHDTYGLNVVLSNCSNNYGPNQFPEKLIPLTINNILKSKSIPVYGNGLNVRDWLYVEDHVSAIDLIFHNGKVGETYNIGGHNEWKNIDLVKKIILTVDKINGDKEGFSNYLIKYTKDRSGHDYRYAIDPTKIQNNLKWKPLTSLDEGLTKTVKWYISNSKWLENIASGEYMRRNKNFSEL